MAEATRRKQLRTFPGLTAGDFQQLDEWHGLGYRDLAGPRGLLTDN